MSIDRQRALRTMALSLAKHSSMGLKSGLYGGRNRSVAPAPSMAGRTPSTLCAARLSAITMSPGCSVGTRICST